MFLHMRLHPAPIYSTLLCAGGPADHQVRPAAHPARLHEVSGDNNTGLTSPCCVCKHKALLAFALRHNLFEQKELFVVTSQATQLGACTMHT